MDANRPIYLDHAATTPVRPEVAEAMWPFFAERFGNPSSLYALAREARRALDAARETVAGVLGCRPPEVIFTSGGTESVNLALRGALEAKGTRGRHLVISAIEHLAVMDTARALARRGFELTVVPVDRHGRVDPADVAAALRDDTALVSVLLASNEIGTVQPVAEIARAVKARDASILVHTDAAVAAGYLDLDVERLGVDLLSISAHKFHGPKGAGALYLRRGRALAPQQFGGPHERGRRAGTENVAGAVGLATALALAQAERDVNRRRDAALTVHLRERILSGLPDAVLVGHPIERLPNNAAFCLPHLDGEMIVQALDRAGIAASSGSACASASLEPSHVLTAIGVSPELAHGSLRLTTGRTNTPAEIERAAETIVAVLRRLYDLVLPPRRR